MSASLEISLALSEMLRDGNRYFNQQNFTKFCNPELQFSSFSVNVQQLILTDPSFSTDTSENKLKNGFRSLIKASNQISLFVRQIRGVLRR